MRDILRELVPLYPFAMIITVIWLGLRTSMARVRARTELQKEVVAKFSSGHELTEFLNSENGKSFLEDKYSSKWTRRGRVITLIVAGIVCIGAGAGFLFGGKDREATGLFIGVGLALIVSGAVSSWLARKVGLNDESNETARISHG